MIKLNTLELFSGTGSFSRVAKDYGHRIYTVDKSLRADILDPNRCDTGKVSKIVTKKFIDQWFPKDSRGDGRVDICWASPPCEAFSVASMGKHWVDMRRFEDEQFRKDYPGYEIIPQPKSEGAKEGLNTLRDLCFRLRGIIRPEIFFIENPRGMMRKVIDEVFEQTDLHNLSPYPIRRHTVTYCSYGDERMKPTDIWTNHPTWEPRPMCHNYKYDKEGNIINRHCHHESARRGAKTGTQGLKGARERSRIPRDLFVEIFDANPKDKQGFFIY